MPQDGTTGATSRGQMNSDEALAMPSSGSAETSALPDLSRTVAIDILVHGARSRAQLTKSMGLSAAPMTGLVKPLLETGVLAETDPVRTPGRGRASLLLDVIA